MIRHWCKHILPVLLMVSSFIFAFSAVGMVWHWPWWGASLLFFVVMALASWAAILWVEVIRPFVRYVLPVAWRHWRLKREGG